MPHAPRRAALAQQVRLDETGEPLERRADKSEDKTTAREREFAERRKIPLLEPSKSHAEI